MSKKISIIIVTYNSESHIYECLESIFQHNDICEGLEVIVVDNMSKNGDMMFNEILQRFGSRIILLKNKRNGGYGQGNNIGIRRATAPIIMVMNPDIRLKQPIFNKIIRYFEIPEVAMVGMKQMISKTRKGLSFNTTYTVDNVFGFFQAVILNRLNIYMQKYMYLSGACFFIRKSVFQEIGLFDEDIFLYGEENDVHYRLRKTSKKYRTIYDQHLMYYHLTDNRPLTMTELQRTFDSKIKFYKKYNLNSKLLFKNEIKYAKLIRLVQFLSRKTENVRLYNEWINKLKDNVSFDK